LDTCLLLCKVLTTKKSTRGVPFERFEKIRSNVNLLTSQDVHLTLENFTLKIPYFIYFGISAIPASCGATTTLTFTFFKDLKGIFKYAKYWDALTIKRVDAYQKAIHCQPNPTQAANSNVTTPQTLHSVGANFSVAAECTAAVSTPRNRPFVAIDIDRTTLPQLLLTLGHCAIGTRSSGLQLLVQRRQARNAELNFRKQPTGKLCLRHIPSDYEEKQPSGGNTREK